MTEQGGYCGAKNPCFPTLTRHYHFVATTRRLQICPAGHIEAGYARAPSTRLARRSQPPLNRVISKLSFCANETGCCRPVQMKNIKIPVYYNCLQRQFETRDFHFGDHRKNGFLSLGIGGADGLARDSIINCRFSKVSIVIVWSLTT